MGKFGWSYPPGAANDPNAPYNQTEDYSLDFDELHDALKEHDTGRWDWEKIDCCLTGKDADLEPWGQQGIELNYVNDEGAMITVHMGITHAGQDVCLNMPPELEEDDEKYEQILEAYLEQAQEVICGIPFMGDWTGDDWYLSDSHQEFVKWPTLDDEGVPDYKLMAQVIVDTAESIVGPWEDENKIASDILNALAGWKTWDKDKKEWVSCPAGKPGPEAVWNHISLEGGEA